MAAPGSLELRGRSRERQELDDALGRVREGESAVLVLRGEAGIGKTALLDYVATMATGCRTLQVAGIESELELPFAALHQLWGPLLGEAEAMPEHQDEALRVALGLAAGTAPDRFLVGLAVLSLVAELAALRAAHQVFADLGAEAFAERARRELVATGEKVRKREVDTLNELTPQEAQIARLAREGHTNPEIAAQLFISIRTVEWHLRKVFAKLGIASRKELAEALPARGTLRG